MQGCHDIIPTFHRGGVGPHHRPAAAADSMTDDPLGQVDAAVRVLRRGGVVVLPTDTLYGLAAAVNQDAAIRRVFRIKGRSGDVGLPLLLADVTDLDTYAAEVPDVARRLADALFPGALTLVLRKRPHVPSVVTGGLETVALRVPDHPVPRAVARRLGHAITGTSANRSGSPDLVNGSQVRAALGDEIDYLVDGGSCHGRVPSTVVDATGEAPLILREGAVSRRRIEEACEVRAVA